MIFKLGRMKEIVKTELVVQDWIDGLSESGQRDYITVLSEFCLVNGLSPTELLEISYSQAEERVPVWEQSIQKWFKKYETHCTIKIVNYLYNY